MTPINLYARIVRYVGRTVAEVRPLLVTSIIRGGIKESDFLVSVYWGGGAGEVLFSLVRGSLVGRSRQRPPWWIAPESAREILAVAEPVLGRCALCHGLAWYAAPAEERP